MSFQELRERDQKYIANVYNRFSADICRGEGATLYSEDGKKFVDFGSGIAVNSFGVNDAEWKAAVVAQLDKVQHASNLYYTRPQVELASLLCERTGAKKVFFSNSGAEANECALKAARKYSFDKYGEGRFHIVTLKNSFHGRTMATLSATGQEAMHRFFMPFLDGFSYADPTAASVRAHCTDKTCAVLLELVQGEGGVRPLDREEVLAIERYCKKHDILLMIDEVQTGNGRTGTLYAYEQYGIRPDVVTTAKGLAGGLPLGATMFFEKCEHTLGAGDHGSTFGGNPVACAGACSILRRIDRDLLLEVQGKSAYLFTQLGRIRNVIGVTGLGLMIGLETTKSAREVAERCLER
ncbi:MAG TPA: aminotransferase class III-fold pyridoxal phosphate-dependent enzyme, partial [Candidatus Borkfalkia faecigallinarum]|nr:aminotransferase class III-fold pyridoxal phosphate-dependent enzyme [Candidatus Borkfalkia faecigallinarum]